MDLIDRQEAIKALEKAGEVNYIATGDFHGIINALNVIKGLPNANPTLTQHSPKWISCSERLPGHEYIDKCILISMAGETIAARILDGINYGRGVWEFDNYSEAMGRDAEFYPWNKIDAWMPLPAPYKEGTDD